MAPSIGLNLRVTGHCNQGGRKYMEDVFSVAYQQTEDEMDLEYAFFGIFDGHGGKEAALFAKVSKNWRKGDDSRTEFLFSGTFDGQHHKATKFLVGK